MTGKTQVSFCYVLSEEAQKDLVNIWEFYARNGESLEDKQIRVILSQVEDLTVFPKLGRSRNDLISNIKSGFGWFEISKSLESSQ